MECIILIGIPASGKTTFYNDKFSDTHLRINLDTLGRRSREKAIFETAIKNKIKICIDNTNVTIKNRKKYIPLLKENNYKIIAIYFLPNLEQAIKWNKQRKRTIPECAIKKYNIDIVAPSKNEGFDEIFIVQPSNNKPIKIGVFK